MELQNNGLSRVVLNWYDYGARFYDPQIGRWPMPDPLAENSFDHSSYLYCSDNPISRIDIFGLQDENPGTQIPEVVITAKRIHKTSQNFASYVQSFGGQSHRQSAPAPISPVKPYVAIKDFAETGLITMHNAKLAHDLTAARLGSLSRFRIRTYGSNFGGSQYVEIIDLTKSIEIGGVVVSAVVVMADALNAYTNGLEGAEKDEAIDQMVNDIVTIGIYAINAEAGILTTVGEMVMNSPEFKQMMNDNRIEREVKQGKWQLPSGPLYFKQGH